MADYTAEKYEQHPYVQAMLQQGDNPTADTMRPALIVQSTALTDPEVFLREKRGKVEPNQHIYGERHSDLARFLRAIW